MKQTFRNRTEAGQMLATRLLVHRHEAGLLVLGLPRGGVPVAFEVAQALRAPLDVFIVRKLGTPGQPELAMGAIATGGIKVFNREVVDGLRIPAEVIDRVARTEECELKRRELAYRGVSAEPDVRGKTVVLVDDGVATGATLRAALEALKQQHPARLIVAVPVGAPSTVHALHTEADEVVAIITPEQFGGVGEWYDDFTQTTDAEVTDLLARATEWAPAARHDTKST